MRLWAGVAFLWCVTVASSPARAEPVTLAVPVDDVCLDGPRLAGLVEHHTVGTGADPLLRVTVDREVATHAVVFTLRRGGVVVSTRRFDTPPSDCDALHAILALAIALALDAQTADSREPTAPQTREAPAVATAPSPTKSVRARVRSATRGPRAVVSVQLTGLFGVARELSLGGSIAAHVSLVEWLELRFGGLGSLPTSAQLGDGTVDIALAAARLDVCPVRAVGRLRARVCGGALLGRAFGVGRGFETPFSTTASWIALLGRVSLTAPLTRRLGIEAAVDVLAPVVRPRFVVLGPGGEEIDAVSVPAWGVMLSVGPALDFP